MGDRTKWKTEIPIPQATPDLQARALFQSKVVKEVERAIELHGNPYWSRHEFWGVFKEEVDENYVCTMIFGIDVFSQIISAVIGNPAGEINFYAKIFVLQKTFQL